MTDLQCPATLLLTRPTGPQGSLALAERLADRRVARVWCSPRPRAVRTARIVARLLGTGLTRHADLAEDDVEVAERAARLRAVIEEISDQYRGETVLVVCGGALLEHTLPLLSAGAPARRPARGTLLVLRVDADDLVVSSDASPSPVEVGTSTPAG